MVFEVDELIDPMRVIEGASVRYLLWGVKHFN